MIPIAKVTISTACVTDKTRLAKVIWSCVATGKMAYIDFVQQWETYLCEKISMHCSKIWTVVFCQQANLLSYSAPFLTSGEPAFCLMVLYPQIF